MILSSVSIENGEFHTAQHFKAPHFQPLVGFVSALNMYHLCTAPYRAAFCICLVFQSSNQSTQFFNWPDSILLQGNLPTDRCACAQENTDLHKSQINNKNRIKCVCFLYPEDDSKKADIRLFKVRWWKVVFQSSCIQIWLKKEKKGTACSEMCKSPPSKVAKLTKAFKQVFSRTCGHWLQHQRYSV